jgi:hypothetical protein
VPKSLLLQQALPELSSVLKGTRDVLLHAEARHHAAIKRQLDSVESSLNALVNGQLSVMFTGPVLGKFTSAMGAQVKSPFHVLN